RGRGPGGRRAGVRGGEVAAGPREPLERVAAAHPEVGLVWGDAMKVDLAALDPAPTAIVATLPYSGDTPHILRTIAELPSLGRWTVMVHREIAERLRARPGS